MSRENIDLVRALIPPPETDVAALIRDDEAFQAIIDALSPLIDRDVESVAVWQGGVRSSGIDGFRGLWLDWLEPWASYHVQVDEVIDAGDRVVVLVRDRARRHDMDAEVEILAGSVWQLEEGRIMRVEFCGDRAEALETAGLRR